MGSYESFAGVYDELMDQVPYEEWWDRIRSVLAAYGITSGLALDLGCGTGKMLRLMAGAGFDMIGIDQSVDMLEVARDQSPEGCLYLNQDMREFELYGTVRAIVSVCDSINYITDPRDLVQTFKLVNNYLDPGGIFIFDVNTEYKYRYGIGDTVIAEDREDVSFIWYNEYDEEDHINEISLRVFVREQGGLFRKFEEDHLQRGYTMEEVIEALHESGLEYLASYDGYSDRKADSKSERIVFVAREQGKSL